MREIFYRANSLEESPKWLYGYPFKIECNGVVFWDMMYSNGCAYGIDSETISQYTGLKDRNGKMIFEGDIIRYYYGEKDGFEPEDGIVYWSGECCGFNVEWDREKDKITPLTAADVLSCEVVGNVYEATWRNDRDENKKNE